MRIEPPWSPPNAMSASPSATTTPDPDADPPAEYPILYGLCTGPLAPVWLLPERQYDSQCVFPTISAPASSNRVTTVASISGTYPSRIELPFIIGTPATIALSLIATFFPLSGPHPPPESKSSHTTRCACFPPAQGIFPASADTSPPANSPACDRPCCMPRRSPSSARCKTRHPRR